ncbi:hypothetical protein AN191_16300 [Loktanella sp. 5RATIMAR09]|uniref:trypsin-like serine protease n=1 Tax=Loktanella sp. 5RATIMAR09 TaxID=1225655 RepID=UPI000707DC7A|nr:trypsin-like serine protease [Loktanella sp. 5RATIMAR09]KQI70741.1 hypothetical protein AN191_16300 [Loktanella sp. 5RATIMAR09]
MLKPAMLTFCILITGCAGLSDAKTANANANAFPTRAPVPVVVATAGGTICNGVRLNGQTVATAAHCLADGTSVSVVEAGLVAPATDTLVHPGYAMVVPELAAGLDLAKLSVASQTGMIGELAIRPVEPGLIEILVLTTSGEYRQIPCGYLGRSGAMVELSCMVSLGWSGAPVVQNGALVGILSARGEVQSVDIVQMADATLLDSFQ